jgi:hypothetical protein
MDGSDYLALGWAGDQASQPWKLSGQVPVLTSGNSQTVELTPWTEYLAYRVYLVQRTNSPRVSARITFRALPTEPVLAVVRIIYPLSPLEHCPSSTTLG